MFVENTTWCGGILLFYLHTSINFYQMFFIELQINCLVLLCNVFIRFFVFLLWNIHALCVFFGGGEGDIAIVIIISVDMYSKLYDKAMPLAFSSNFNYVTSKHRMILFSKLTRHGYLREASHSFRKLFSAMMT